MIIFSACFGLLFAMQMQAGMQAQLLRQKMEVHFPACICVEVVHTFVIFLFAFTLMFCFMLGLSLGLSATIRVSY